MRSKLVKIFIQYFSKSTLKIYKKTTFYILLFVLTQNICFSQVDNSEHWANSGWEYGSESDSIYDVSTKVIFENDLSYLLKYPYPRYGTDRDVIPAYGLLGTDYKKIEILYTHVSQNKKDAATYNIIGRTKLGDTINDLKGTVTFKNATAHFAKDNDENKTTVVLVGSYTLTEKHKKKKVATLTGAVKLILFPAPNSQDFDLFDTSYWYEDGAVRGFVGVRKTHKNKVSKPCIWNFPRVPYEYAPGFDLGAGEEMIDIKYARTWFNHTDQEWNDLLKENPEGLFSYGDEENYIEPNVTDWFEADRLDKTVLENRVLKQLKLKRSSIALEYMSMSEFNKYLDETIVVVPEYKGAILDLDVSDYELTAHILIVNSITGKIKYHFKEENLSSNAISIENISIDPEKYSLTTTENAFGISVDYRNGSQPNPYSATSYSLYIKENNELKRVLDNLEISESIGIVNVSGDCYAEFTEIEREIWVNEENNTNGYYDIGIIEIDSKYIYEVDSEGDCNKKRVRNVRSLKDLKYNNTSYQEISDH